MAVEKQAVLPAQTTEPLFTPPTPIRAFTHAVRRLLTTFDLHLLRRLIGGYVLFVFALIVFFVVLHYVEYVDDFMDRGAKLSEVFRVYYPAYIPEIVRLTSPLALFLAAVYVTNRLAQQFQIMALQAGGVSLYRLLLPYALTGLLATAGLFALGGYVVPHAQRIVLAFDQQYLKSDEGPVEVSDLHRQNAPGSFLTVGFYDHAEGIGYRASLLRYDGVALQERIDASRIVWVDSAQAWQFEDVTRRVFTGEAPRQTQIPVLDTVLNVLPANLAQSVRDVEGMTIPEAQTYLASLQRTGSGYVGTSLVAYYSKFSYPAAHLILALLALPLAAQRRRGGAAITFAIGLFIAFLYLATQKLIEPFGATGALSPLTAAWLPHAVFGAVTLVVLLAARK